MFWGQNPQLLIAIAETVISFERERKLLKKRDTVIAGKTLLLLCFHKTCCLNKSHMISGQGSKAGKKAW